MNADPLKPTDAERAANAIVSLRNDERMRHLSLHFHDQFYGGGSESSGHRMCGTRPASTHPQRNPAQPSRAGIPAAFDPNPPTQEEVAEAYQFKYGLAHEAG